MTAVYEVVFKNSDGNTATATVTTAGGDVQKVDSSCIQIDGNNRVRFDGCVITEIRDLQAGPSIVPPLPADAKTVEIVEKDKKAAPLPTADEDTDMA